MILHAVMANNYYAAYSDNRMKSMLPRKTYLYAIGNPIDAVIACVACQE